MRAVRLSPWCAALIALLLAMRVDAGEPRRILIEIDGKAKFDVVYHRARSNATGAIIGGLIGAGIQSGIEADKDAEKREALWPHVAEHAWRDVFVRTMTDTMVAKGLEPVWVDADADAGSTAADLYLKLFPESFGFRMVDSTTGLVSAYVEFDAKTQQSIYRSQYAGSYTEEKAGGLEKSWTIVMNRALDKLVEDIVLDEELAAALGERAAAAPKASP